MKKIITLFSILALVFVTSCSDQNDSNGDNSFDKNAIVIIDNQTQLNQRLDLTNSGVISILNPLTGKSLETETAQLPLTQIAEFKAPTDNNGNTLQASHVAVNDNYAYVSYTSQGNEYSGAIDMIDISDPYKPRLVISALIPDIDISSLVCTNGKLLIAGAVNLDKNPLLTSPAIVMTMPLKSDGTLTADVEIHDLESYVTTDIVINATNFFAVTGDNGSLFKFDNTGNLIGKIGIDDLRTVAVNNNKIVALSGTKGISVYDASNLELIKSFATFNEGKNGSKRTIDFVGDNILVSEGAEGLGVYNLTSGNKNQTFSITPKTGIDAEDAVTNAVSVNGDYAFVANGGNGLNVYKTGDQLSLVGTLGIDGSSNYVKTSGDYMYVASGKGGLKIIKMEKPATTPSNCVGLPAYVGDSNLNVNSGQVLAYSGSTALNWVNVNASLTLCGSTTIQNDLNINSSGIFKMYGTLSQGKYQQAYPTNMNINGELQIEGSVVIWGNLTMNSGAKLTFLGSNSSITIYGNVTKNSGVTITGTYTDTENKLKK